MMTRATRHLVLPLVPTIVFLAIAAMPVQALGCRTRGWLAFGVALACGLAAIASALIALRGRLRGDRVSFWWIGTAAVLAIPVIAMLRLA